MSDQLVEEVRKPGATYHRSGRTTSDGMQVFGEDGHQRYESRSAALKAAGAPPEDDTPTDTRDLGIQGAAPDIVSNPGVMNSDQVAKTSEASQHDPKAEEAEAAKRKAKVDEERADQIKADQQAAEQRAEEQPVETLEDTAPDEHGKTDKRVVTKPRGELEDDEQPKAETELQAETDDALAQERDAKPKRGRKPKNHTPGVDDNSPEPTGPDRA